MGDRFMESETARWAQVVVPGRMVDGVLLVSPKELSFMRNQWGEYSCSMPTGHVIGKRWLRDKLAYTPGRFGVNEWWMLEYVAHANPEFIGLKWTRVQLDPEVLVKEVVAVLEAAT